MIELKPQVQDFPFFLEFLPPHTVIAPLLLSHTLFAMCSAQYINYLQRPSFLKL
jgi:hypothetical protein